MFFSRRTRSSALPVNRSRPTDTERAHPPVQRACGVVFGVKGTITRAGTISSGLARCAAAFAEAPEAFPAMAGDGANKFGTKAIIAQMNATAPRSSAPLSSSRGPISQERGVRALVPDLDLKVERSARRCDCRVAIGECLFVGPAGLELIPRSLAEAQLAVGRRFGTKVERWYDKGARGHERLIPAALPSSMHRLRIVNDCFHGMRSKQKRRQKSP